MIKQDDMDALAEGNEVMDRVEKRMKAGTAHCRELMGRETRPFILAALAWRQAAMNLYLEKMQAAQDATRLHRADSKYARAEAEQ